MAMSLKNYTLLCERIEKACRGGPLDEEEAGEQSLEDRRLLSTFYQRYKNQKGSSFLVAARRARLSMISLILNEELKVLNMDDINSLTAQ